MGPRKNLWFKIGSFSTLSVAGATVITQTERSIEARKYLRSKERELQEKPEYGIQENSPWLRGTRRSSFLKPTSSNQFSTTEFASMLRCFRAHKDDSREVGRIHELRRPTEEIITFVEASWSEKSEVIKVTIGAEVNGPLDEIAFCNSPQSERNYENIKALDKCHTNEEYGSQEGLRAKTNPPVALAWSLHHSSTDLFANFAPLLLQSTIFDKYKAGILEDIGRMYLWGESFNQEELAIILDSSPRLKSLVLELTDTLCTVLIEDLFPLIHTSNSDPTLLQQIRKLKNVLQQFHFHLEQMAHSQNETHSTDDYSESDSEVEDGTSDPGSIAAMIRSNVNCLMQLLPSMERTLEVVKTQLLSTPELQMKMDSASIS